MKLLIDTHAFVWATIEPFRLSARVRDLIADPENICLVSAVSAYEILFKRENDAALRRLPEDLVQAVAQTDFEWLSIDVRHASAAARLPRHHRDPWDRILIAQAMAEDADLVSADRRLSAYDARLIW